jgi:hypothetical protein
VEDATGVDMAELFLRQVIGVDIGEFPEFQERRDGPRYHAAGAIRYVAVDHHGTLEGIDGWEEVRAMPGVVDAHQTVPDGRPAGRAHQLVRPAGLRASLERGRRGGGARASTAVAALTVRLGR